MKKLLIITLLVLICLIIIPEILNTDEAKISSNHKDENSPKTPKKNEFPLATIPVVPEIPRLDGKEKY